MSEVWMPDDPGNEDEDWLAVMERAIDLAGTRLCKCSHLEIEHPGGACVRKLCGCGEFRPKANTSSMASRAGDFPAAGRAAS